MKDKLSKMWSRSQELDCLLRKKKNGEESCKRLVFWDASQKTLAKRDLERFLQIDRLEDLTLSLLILRTCEKERTNGNGKRE